MRRLRRLKSRWLVSVFVLKKSVRMRRNVCVVKNVDCVFFMSCLMYCFIDMLVGCMWFVWLMEKIWFKFGGNFDDDF